MIRSNRSRCLQIFIIANAIWSAVKGLCSSKKEASTKYIASLSNYQIDYRHASILSIIAFAADLYAIPAILRNKPAISAIALIAVNPASVPPQDQIALKQNPDEREAFRRLSDNVLRGIIMLPAIFLLDSRLRRDAGPLLMIYAWLHAITYTIYSYSPLGPAFNNKYRPVVYYTAVPQAERSLGNNRNSRYSGHTGNAACAAFFMAKVYSDYHPEWRPAVKRILYLLACLPPLLLGWLRIKALKHFPSDVLLATVIGGSCGVLITGLYNRNN